jgi:hypothetical protein
LASGRTLPATCSLLLGSSKNSETMCGRSSISPASSLLQSGLLLGRIRKCSDRPTVSLLQCWSQCSACFPTLMYLRNTCRLRYLPLLGA